MKIFFPIQKNELPVLKKLCTGFNWLVCSTNLLAKYTVLCSHRIDEFIEVGFSFNTTFDLLLACSSSHASALVWLVSIR